MQKLALYQTQQPVNSSPYVSANPTAPPDAAQEENEQYIVQRQPCQLIQAGHPLRGSILQQQIF